jgi:hypothetical protein
MPLRATVTERTWYLLALVLAYYVRSVALHHHRGGLRQVFLLTAQAREEFLFVRPPVVRIGSSLGSDHRINDDRRLFWYQYRTSYSP